MKLPCRSMAIGLLALSSVACGMMDNDSGNNADNNKDKGQLITTTTQQRLTQPGVPGGIQQNVSRVEATVKAIDYKQRRVTLVDKQGNQKTLSVPEDARNFGQVEKGDAVTITYTEELAVFLKEKGAAKSQDGGAVMVAKAPAGSKPGALAAESVAVTAIVKAIDFKQRTATLQTEDGATRVFKVRDDVVLDKKQIGREVVFRTSNAMLLTVEKR